MTAPRNTAHTATSIPLAATQPQFDFIESLRKRLHLSDQLLDNHCQRIFGCDAADISKHQATRLIDEMKGWAEMAKGLPPVIQREAGQVDLPGFGS